MKRDMREVPAGRSFVWHKPTDSLPDDADPYLFKPLDEEPKGSMLGRKYLLKIAKNPRPELCHRLSRSYTPESDASRYSVRYISSEVSSAISKTNPESTGTVSRSSSARNDDLFHHIEEEEEPNSQHKSTQTEADVFEPNSKTSSAAQPSAHVSFSAEYDEFKGKIITTSIKVGAAETVKEDDTDREEGGEILAAPFVPVGPRTTQNIVVLARRPLTARPGSSTPRSPPKSVFAYQYPDTSIQDNPTRGVHVSEAAFPAWSAPASTRPKTSRARVQGSKVRPKTVSCTRRKPNPKQAMESRMPHRSMTGMSHSYAQKKTNPRGGKHAAGDQWEDAFLHPSAYMHSLDLRKQKRQHRTKPWAEKPPDIAAREKENKIRVHYDSYLPTQTWLEMKPMSYSTNYKHGQAYRVRYSRDKPTKPGSQEWLMANDYRIWLLEKQKENVLQTDFSQGIGGATGRLNEKDKSKKSQNGSLRSRKSRIGVESEYDASSSAIGELLKSGAGTKGKKRGSLAADSHADLYEQYQTIQRERVKQHTYAVEIQRFLRGWVVRSRIRRLQNRVLRRHSSTWQQFIKDYKGLVTRIQKRYNVALPEAPFKISEINEFLEKKEQYEKVFYDMAIAEKLPRHILKKFFTECGLNPSEKEINTAYQAVFKECTSKAEIVFVVDCGNSLGDDNFRIQAEFVKEVISCLHVGDQNVRVGYVPYNTDVFENFGLDQFASREDVIKGIEHVRYKKGITRTDLALKKMRDFMKGARYKMPMTAILITDGGAYASYATEKQAELCRKEGIRVFCLGVGRTVEKKEMYAVAYDEDHVFFINNYYEIAKVRTQLMKAANLMNCKHCMMISPQELQQDMSRGLYKDEVMEVMWMVYPPKATGFDPHKRKKWMKKNAHGEGINFFGDDDEDDSDFNTCLKFIIKSKLEKDGVMIRPRADGRDLEEVKTWEDAIQKAQGYVHQQLDKSAVTKQRANLVSDLK